MDDIFEVLFHLFVFSFLVFLLISTLKFLSDYGKPSDKDISLAIEGHYICYLDLEEVDINTIDLSDHHSYHVTFDHSRRVVLVTSSDRHDVVSHRDITLDP